MDARGDVLLNMYVKPAEPIVSYLTPLTGLTAELIDAHGIPLEQAVAALRQVLPSSATLVGHSIGKDVGWLGLAEGKDFAGLIDLAGLFRVWNAKYNSWSMFGQDQIFNVLLPHLRLAEDAPHDAVGDALKSIQLWNLHNQLTAPGPDAPDWLAAQQMLLTAPQAPSFAVRNPLFDNVCMGNKKKCVCGAPFVYG